MGVDEIRFDTSSLPSSSLHSSGYGVSVRMSGIMADFVLSLYHGSSRIVHSTTGFERIFARLSWYAQKFARYIFWTHSTRDYIYWEEIYGGFVEITTIVEFISMLCDLYSTWNLTLLKRNYICISFFIYRFNYNQE